MIETVREIDEDQPTDVLSQYGLVIALVLGVGLWVQLASFTLRQELGGQPGLIRMLAFVVPFAALGAGAWLRSAIWLLALFPMSLLPPLFLTPDGLAASFGDPWSAARVCASFALYLALVSTWVGGVETHGRVEHSESSSRPGGVYRRHVLMRVVPLLLWWTVPTYAVFWDSAIVGTLVQSFGDDARIAQVFISLVAFFGWCIVAYMSFIVPTLNLEYDLRRHERRVEELTLPDTARPIVRRIAIAALLAFAGTVALLMVI